MKRLGLKAAPKNGDETFPLVSPLTNLYPAMYYCLTNVRDWLKEIDTSSLPPSRQEVRVTVYEGQSDIDK